MANKLTAKQQEIADYVCSGIGKGKSLRSLCEPKDMPAHSTVLDWVRDNTDFADQYTRAREVQADTIFDEILEIADDSKNDFMESQEGHVSTNQENIQRSRLRIDARKWMAGKMRPKKYSDHIRQEISGPDGKAIELEVKPSSKLTGFLDVIAKRSGEAGEPS